MGEGPFGLPWHKASVDDVADRLDALPPMPVFVTFVHAHMPETTRAERRNVQGSAKPFGSMPMIRH
ncbi:hypothetical protein WME88_56205 [Sorangium sp. So ce216]